MIPPHIVSGNDILLEEGQITLTDLGELIYHLRRTHTQWRTSYTIWITNRQAHQMRTDPDFAGYYQQARDHFPMDPSLVGRVWGTDIRRGRPERNPYIEGYWHPTDYNYRATLVEGERPQTAPYFTVANTAAAAEQLYRNATDAMTGWKTQFMVNTLTGKTLDGVWLDEPKSRVETTHENW